MKYLADLVEVVESLGLRHEPKFLDCITIKLSPYYYIINDVKGTLMLVERYFEDSCVSPSTIRDLVLRGYDLEFKGTFVYLTLFKPKGIKETLLALKNIADEFPKGFSTQSY